MDVDLLTSGRPALTIFRYENGYTITMSDLGSDGILIELTDPNEGSAAVIMPPDKVQRCAYWMLRTLALRKQSFPARLTEMLGKVVNSKRLNHTEKNIICEAMQILQDLESGNGQTS
jgi:hypothetical protein